MDRGQVVRGLLNFMVKRSLMNLGWIRIKIFLSLTQASKAKFHEHCRLEVMHFNKALVHQKIHEAVSIIVLPMFFLVIKKNS
jgi:hypothetical protein